MITVSEILHERKATSLTIWFVSFLAFGVIHSQVTGRLYPGVPLALVLSEIALVAVAVYGTQHSEHLLAAVVLFSVLWKTYLFVFPASLYGIDPDWYAWQVHLVSQSASTDTIRNAYYRDSPLFIVFAVIFRAVGGLTASQSLLVYSVAVGAILPISVYAIAMRVWENRSIALLAASLIMFEPTTMVRSFYPIAQTTVVMLLPVIVLLFMGMSRRPIANYVCVVVIVVALAFTHKLGLVVPFVYLVFLFAAVSYEWFWRGTDPLRSIQEVQWILPVSLLVSALIFIQMTIITEFITQPFISLVGDGTMTDKMIRSSFVVEPAVHSGGILGFVWATKYQYVYFSLAGVAGLVTFFRDFERNVHVLSVAGATLFLFTLNYTAPGVIPAENTRWSVFTAPFVMILVAGLLSYVDVDAKRGAFVVVVLILVSTQIFSGVAIKDGPGRPRYYLTQSEMDSKMFAVRYVPGAVHTDSYLAHERLPEQIQRGDPNRFRSVTEPILKRSLGPGDYEYLLLRNDQEVYRAPTQSLQIRYDVRKTVESDTSVNHIYSNNDTDLYKSR